MFQTSASTEKLDAALAKAQAEISAAVKDKTNPAYRSKYADLASVWEACRDALTKHGVSVTQWPLHSDDDKLHMLTRLACAGEWMQATFSIPVGKKDAHGYGSATTYAKRFALSAAVGVVADDDDDGNLSVGKNGANPLKAPITPTTGAWDDVAPAREEYIRRIGLDVVALVESDDLENAYDYLYVDNKDAGKINNDEFTAIWAMLQPYSAARNKLKKMRNEKTGALASQA